MDIDNDNSNFFLRDNLRTLRKRMNWSQGQLADKIGLNRGNIASYENGTAEPKICNLMKLAGLFKISVFDITHSNLKEDGIYQSAANRSANGHAILQGTSLERYEKEAEDFGSAIKGLQCLSRLKIRDLDKLPDEVQSMTDYFEQLHSVSQHLLKSHLELISLVKSKCHDH
jgi:transcriptional regulator with XRE-family HTH domain